MARRSYGIIGLGRFGSTLAQTLHSLGAEVIALDNDEQKLKEIMDDVSSVFTVSNQITVDTLKSAGLDNCDVIVVCIGSNVESSILITLSALELNGPVVHAKANTKGHGKVLEKIGAKTIYPESEMAVRKANLLESNNLLDVVFGNQDFTVAEFVMTEKYANQSIQSLNFRKIYDLNIIAIKHEDKFTHHIEPDTIIYEGDKIIACSDKEGISKFREALQES